MSDTPSDDPQDGPERFCRDFAAVLDARGVSVREAAERSNWSKSAIGNARTGPRLPTADLVTAVLAALGLPDDEVGAWARRHATLVAAAATAPPVPGPGVPLGPRPTTVSADVAPPSVPPTAPTAPTAPVAATPSRTGRAVVTAVLVTAVVAGAAGWFGGQLTSASAAAEAPGAVVVTVQNKVALGAEDLVEDVGPAYLSSRAIAFCGSRGCKESGTDVVSGALLPATCTVAGERMWNYDLDSPARSNPHRAESALWYRLSWPDGRTGYLSEVYLEPASRGGLGLPACA
ncbi:helix-turn-helix domain-containing protein [Pseudonocardia spirodelae]|uniref:Helix-turn-helix transcriptional regulator n=1 Tax=Pseudonocardia spirodelae TaxID=3133431 RepID=A0ABU8T8U0_9PSEU